MNPKDDELKSISRIHNSVNISVDPRIELLSIVQYLGDYEIHDILNTNLEFDYKKDIESYFTKYKEHNAVKLFEDLVNNNFNCDAPPTSVLYVDNKFNPKHNLEVTDYLHKRAGGKENLEKFFSLLGEFSIDTNFKEFFNNHVEYYNKIIDKTILKMGNTNFIKEVEDFYGFKQNSYNLILVSLYFCGGFGPKVHINDRRYDIYSIVGPSELSDDIINFGNEEDFKNMQRHEFSHSFVNYLVDNHIDDINKYQELYTPIKEIMTKQAYTSWNVCVKEHIVRTFTTMMAFKDSHEEGQKALEEEKSLKFIYIDKLLEKFYEYEKSRDKYKTFEEYFPELIMAFDYYTK